MIFPCPNFQFESIFRNVQIQIKLWNSYKGRFLDRTQKLFSWAICDCLSFWKMPTFLKFIISLLTVKNKFKCCYCLKIFTATLMLNITLFWPWHIFKSSMCWKFSMWRYSPRKNSIYFEIYKMSGHWGFCWNVHSHCNRGFPRLINGFRHNPSLSVMYLWWMFVLLLNNITLLCSYRKI